MYFVLMGPDDSRNHLCDYRPNITCPQWYRDIRRAYKFPTPEAAAEFRASVSPRWDLGKIRIVRITTRADRRAERAALKAENERLRDVIKTGGAMYRAERARMGIPGGIDAYESPWLAQPSSTSQRKDNG